MARKQRAAPDLPHDGATGSLLSTAVAALRSGAVGAILGHDGSKDEVAQAKEFVELLPSFLERTQIDRAALRPGTRGMLGPDKDFWDPHQSQSLRTGQVARPNARSLNLGFDDSRGDVVVAYLMDHGT